MKKLQVTFNGVTDTTGYLFSLMKSLSAVLRCSRYAAWAEDVVAASGFAFRMWIEPIQLCPSATSIWNFSMQKLWVENSGLTCGYVERLWNAETIEESRRQEALCLIRNSIDSGFAPVAWDLSGCEWGILLGYDDAEQQLTVRNIDGREGTLPYEKLGNLEIPILSVLTVTGAAAKEPETLVSDTKKLALTHLRGEEWCENAQGIAAYDALLTFIREKLTAETLWNLEYNLGTYAALKWYAWKFFEKYGETALAERYCKIYGAWQNAFERVRDGNVLQEDGKAEVLALLTVAKAEETAGMEELERT